MALKSALINVMEGAARKAARGMVRDFGEVEQLQVSMKGPSDFVSTADLKAESILKRELQKARPDFGLRFEESAETTGDGINWWIVDPLDGTTNFLHGIPHFCISIAVAQKGELVAGLILEPTRDELFWAEKGTGAYLNGHRLRVSGRARLGDAILATGIPFRGRPGHEIFIEEMQQVMPLVAGIRRFGAAALDLAYVAAGRFDGFWERGLSPWDMAAGAVLVREAGGLVSQIDGGERFLEKGDIVATNTTLYSDIRAVLRKAGRA